MLGGPQGGQPLAGVWCDTAIDNPQLGAKKREIAVPARGDSMGSALNNGERDLKWGDMHIRIRGWDDSGPLLKSSILLLTESGALGAGAVSTWRRPAFS